ncbi:sulfide:quinone oxidoreductase, mitochondrial [Orussus abietinus]|uniref:sulfide:quinone oxidoreductase, mitochondrial n=1 Tax=Orussus abietinus TaxID=222816 RepID=UPI00062519AA|nr:sulfide:quinone oxidoreductase, mitochondrial [Orussus abietinus]XP_012274038.1 sulfide:quinone oxidoreductase, mitochondrial [Orussus abietinus]XP_012274039.1 sulfide:quinone oxidoreductase, mitochondrial [Orussus abietinus]
MYNSVGSNLLSINRILYFQNAYRNAHHSCKVLVVGGGTGGCTMAAKFARKFKDSSNQVIIVEPSEVHYYQPMFTLIGGGIKHFKSSHRPMASVLPKEAKWIKDSVMSFEPECNKVTTSNGDVIQYDVMIVAMGLQLYWDKIPGLVEGLQNPDSQVCSIYGPDTVSDVFIKIQKTRDGTAVFTFPNTAVKCPGAPQKIAYIAEDFWRKHNMRDKINVVYNTALPVIFGVKRYADELWNVCNKRDITVNLSTNLLELNPDKKEALFQNLKNPGETYVQQYSLLHVCPPMGPPEILKAHKSLTNEIGFLTVDAKTLRHNKYLNVYGIGDCTNTPNSKTMAAVASQAKVLYKNILDSLEGKPMIMVYDGYASCPLVTGYGKCILAEFDYNLQPKETFPIEQNKESFLMYLLKKHFFPFLYWNFMLKGYWDGPEFSRKCFHPFERKRSS